MERGRGAYISLCISVMYTGEIRGEGVRQTGPWKLSISRHRSTDNLNEKIWDVRMEGGEVLGGRRETDKQAGGVQAEGCKNSRIKIIFE